jgi:hypothetical protein
MSCRETKILGHWMKNESAPGPSPAPGMPPESHRIFWFKVLPVRHYFLYSRSKKCMYMVPFHEVKLGDILLAEFDGTRTEGEVIELNHEDKEVCVSTNDNEFWYTPDHLFAIPLDDAQLQKFHFQSQVNGDRSIKYMRGPFRILLPEKGNFSNFEIWYREDLRHITHHLSVHELQNHYHQMTKVELTRG